MSFENKVILITGGGSGIGAETARHFARLKGSVAIADRNEAGLKEVADEIKLADGIPPLIIAADVTKDADRIINETFKHFGKLDVLVNNAGIIATDTISTITPESFDRVFDVNVRSVIRLTQLAVPHLEKTKGNIINTSSIAGLQPFDSLLSYCMSKSAVNQFTKCTALELASKRIRCNAVNPGVIDTPLYEQVGATAGKTKEFTEKLVKKQQLGRVGKVEDIAQAIVFLAAESAGFITGVLLRVDGGACMPAL